MSLKILILNYEYPPVGGGGGIISKYIAQGLMDLGHSVTVVTTWISGEKELENSSGKPMVIRLKSKRKNDYRSNPKEMLSWMNTTKQFLTDYLPTTSFDLCFANFALPGGEVALYLKRKFGLPYVLLSHGHDIPWVKPVDLLFIYHAITYGRIKKICANSELNFIQSSWMKSNIDKFLGSKLSDKNIVISNGVDTERFNWLSKSDNRTFNIIFVGRLVAQKDPVTLLKAIRFVSETIPCFKLDIYGDGPMRNELEKLCVRYNLLGRVIFHGKIANDQMPEIFQSAHLLVAPSISEGMSISILEALSSGVYVLTTPVSGNRELINEGENGELLEIGNEQVFANRIEDFYRQKFCKKFVVNQGVLERFRAKWDWEILVREYETQLLKVSIN